VSKRTPREHPPNATRGKALKVSVADRGVDVGDQSRLEGPRDLIVSGAGLLTLYALFAQSRSNERTPVFVIDSGASAHMTPLRSMLVDVNPRAGHVTLGDKSVKLDIRASGHSRLYVLGTFLWVPQLTFTLIFIPALDRIGCRTVLYDGEASITFNGEVILSGTLIYHLDPVFVEQLGEDSGSDMPEREAADECAMTSLAFELERIEHSLQVIAKDVKGVHSASLATDKTPGTVVVEDMRVRGSTETAEHHYGYPGGNSAPQHSRVWEQGKDDNETAEHHYGYLGGNSVHHESIPSSIALMSLGPEDKAVGFLPA
jgi:hypothetical protein